MQIYEVFTSYSALSYQRDCQCGRNSKTTYLIHTQIFILNVLRRNALRLNLLQSIVHHHLFGNVPNLDNINTCAVDL